MKSVLDLERMSDEEFDRKYRRGMRAGGLAAGLGAGMIALNEIGGHAYSPKKQRRLRRGAIGATATMLGTMGLTAYHHHKDKKRRERRDDSVKK